MTKCQTKLVKKNFSTFFMLKIDRNHKNKILKKKIFFKNFGAFWAQKWLKMTKMTRNPIFQDLTALVQPAVYDTTIF